MKWTPPKREGALLHAPIQSSNDPVSVTVHAPRVNCCDHAHLATRHLPPGSVHHARVVCAQCGAFIRWLPKPETIQRRRLNAIKLTKLALCGGLNTWQRNFIRDVSQLRCLSPRQQSKLDEIAAAHLKGELAS